MLNHSLTIAVLPSDMKKGVINSLTADPFALACQRAGLKDVKVGRRTLTYSHTTFQPYLTDEGETLMVEVKDEVCIPLPHEAVEWLAKLTYTDRFEMLKTDKKGHYIPACFTLTSSLPFPSVEKKGA